MRPRDQTLAGLYALVRRVSDELAARVATRTARHTARTHAGFHAKVSPVVLEQDQLRLRGGQKHLPAELRQQREQAPAARLVELARDVVEQQDRHAPDAPA